MNSIKKQYIPIALILIAVVFSFQPLLGQEKNIRREKKKDKGSGYFPELIFTEIPGAPQLSPPILVMGDTKPVMGEGMGWASPAFHDVDGDGKKDLLIGEFGSRMEDNGLPVGSFVRVYKNIGTEEQPRFNDFYEYLRGSTKGFNFGTPLSIQTWCCLGFTPRLVDLDNDGHLDLVSGQYDPGFITWFRGSEDGFQTGKPLPQFGDHMLGIKSSDFSQPWTDPDNWSYWVYSSAAFGDLDGDGLQDMILGGSSLRVSLNIGTKSEPVFGRRKLLLDIDGNPLTTLSKPDTAIGYWGDPSYGHRMIPFVVDWDNDGILDLLVTNGHYSSNTNQVVTFFKGVEVDDEICFQPGIPLFEAKEGRKAFPGANVHVYVADWNKDGVNDLIIGTSVPVIDGKFNSELAWSWEMDTKSLVSPANYSKEMKQMINESLKTFKQDSETYQQLVEKYYGKKEYQNLARQGYVYVMLGKNNERND